MSGVKICEDCFCSCWVVSSKTIIALSELTESSSIRTSDINLANADLSELIGPVCFNELCSALSKAVEQANEYNSIQSNTSKKNAIEYLDQKWVNLVSNMFFKAWYSNRVCWHWLEGSSLTQIKKVGLITTSNEDEEFKNNFKHAAEPQRKRLALVAERNASNFKDKFKKEFWELPSVSKNYSCSEFCKCEKEDEKPGYGDSIGMSALDK